jgi:hypothetical protein
MDRFAAGKARQASEARRRSPWVAALLSLLMPGLGNMHIGQTPRGTAVLALRRDIVTSRRNTKGAANMPVDDFASLRRQTANSLLMTVLLGIMLVMLQTASALAQEKAGASYPKLAREGYALSQVEAEGLESLLKTSPDDLASRTKILGFYFRGAVRLLGRDATIEGRRRHILWLIEHHPESEVVALAEATIDPAGHSLADKAGYEQASKLWIEQARRHEASAAVLGNAAKFFQLSDKDRTISLLKQAQHAAPDDRQWSSRIGYVYALAILGVDMINQNGLPTSHNSAEAKGDFALRAMDELKTSSDAIVVGIAGRIVGQYGLMLGAIYRGTDRFTVDYVPLAETFLIRAQELEPANPQWSRELERFRELRSTAARSK